MFENAMIIAGIAIVWAIFPIGLAYSVWKLEIETGGVEDPHGHHESDHHHDHHDEKMAA